MSSPPLGTAICQQKAAFPTLSSTFLFYFKSAVLNIYTHAELGLCTHRVHMLQRGQCPQRDQLFKNRKILCARVIFISFGLTLLSLPSMLLRGCQGWDQRCEPPQPCTFSPGSRKLNSWWSEACSKGLACWATLSISFKVYLLWFDCESVPQRAPESKAWLPMQLFRGVAWRVPGSRGLQCQHSN